MKGTLFLMFVVVTFAQDADNKGCSGSQAKSPIGGTGCGSLFSPKNGRMDLTIGLSQTDPEKAFFSCNPGYNLVGPTTITCKNSNWEGKEPTCQPVDCGPPKAPENGRVEYIHTTYQFKAHYYCDPCATLVGRHRISCKRSGLWSKTLPTCIFNKECPPITLPSHSFVADSVSIRPTTVKCGEKVKIKCSSGFRLVGSGIATCQPDGTYSWLGGDKASYCHELNWS